MTLYFPPPPSAERIRREVEAHLKKLGKKRAILYPPPWEVVIHYPDGTCLTTDDGKLQDKISAQINQRIRVILSKGRDSTMIQSVWHYSMDRR